MKPTTSDLEYLALHFKRKNTTLSKKEQKRYFELKREHDANSQKDGVSCNHHSFSDYERIFKEQR